MNDMIQTGFDYAALPVESADQLRTWKIEIAAFTDTVESSLVQIGLRFQKAQEELSRQGIKGDGFVAWIEAETKYSCSSAYRLIDVATKFKDKPFPNLGKSVLYALSAPSTPESVIDKAIEKAESGEKVTVADVKDWKAEEEQWKKTVAFHKKKAESMALELALERQRSVEWKDQWKAERDKPAVEKAPDDYETAKAKAVQLESELAKIRKEQDRLINSQVKAKLHEYQSEVDTMEQKKRVLEDQVTRMKDYLASLEGESRRIEVHQQVIEEQRLKLISLAAFLSDEEPMHNADTAKRWRALGDMLKEAYLAVSQYTGDAKPSLTVIHGGAA